MSQLTAKERDLSERVGLLTGEAKQRQGTRDIPGARRKLIERRRCQDQLARVSNSICVLDSHSNALEGTELNKSILNTIRASGEAIKKLSIKGGMGSVEDIISEVETQIENSAEITKVISAGNISGVDGYSEWDLDQELQELLGEEIVDAWQPAKIPPSELMHRKLSVAEPEVPLLRVTPVPMMTA